MVTILSCNLVFSCEKCQIIIIDIEAFIRCIVSTLLYIPRKMLCSSLRIFYHPCGFQCARVTRYASVHDSPSQADISGEV